MERLIVLDTETTGIEPSEGHRIIEIGCVEILDRAVTDSSYQQYIQPNRNVGESFRIHNISDNSLKGKPKFEEVASEFLEYIEGSTLVIHNAPFDLGFLNHELKLMGSETTIEDHCKKVIDTFKNAKKQFPGSMHGLDALCRRFEIDTSARTVSYAYSEQKAHGALLDSQMLAQVYLAMTGGQSVLFSDTNHTNQEETNESSVIKVDIDQARIKVIQANKTEVEAHNIYFEKV